MIQAAPTVLSRQRKRESGVLFTTASGTAGPGLCPYPHNCVGIPELVPQELTPPLQGMQLAFSSPQKLSLVNRTNHFVLLLSRGWKTMRKGKDTQIVKFSNARCFKT